MENDVREGLENMATLPHPVHLYVKKHKRTGLKYFGRTTG